MKYTDGEMPANMLNVREWYAGMALQGYLAAHAGLVTNIPSGRFASLAFQLADAMIAESKKSHVGQ